ncbi:hypothetical protein HNV12_13870 [Methanococcoides sp. SA1]|nr:hypothetical protein [Methanococcoides sp. SA1]
MNILVKDTAEIFDTIGKWENYCELVSLKENIVNEWRQIVHNKIMEYFNRTENQVKGWSFDFTEYGETPHFRWIPEGCETLLTLNLYRFKDFNLWLHANEVDSSKVKNTIKTEQFKSLLLNHRNDNDSHDWFVFEERGNFYFDGAPCNGNFDGSRMLWYAYHKFDRYIEQLHKKLDLIRTEENQILFQQLYSNVKN